MDDSSPGSLSDKSAPQEPAVPIFVEVITEEPVEYVVPEPPSSIAVPMTERDDRQPATDDQVEPTDMQSTVPHPILDDTGESSFQQNEPPIKRPLGTTAPLPPKPSDNGPEC